MVTRRKLLVLWAVAGAAYALLFVLTSPVLMVPPERQAAVVEAYLARVEEQHAQPDLYLNGCWPPPETVVAEQFNMTQRNVMLIIRSAYRDRQLEDPCRGRHFRQPPGS